MKKGNVRSNEMTPQQRDLSGPVIRLGLDIGYGYVKAITANQKIIFPSVWGVGREIRYSEADILKRYPGDLVTDDQGRWFMGELALTQLRPAEHMMLRGRTANDDAIGNVARIRLMKATLGKLFSDVRDDEVIHLQIATGLPVSHMQGSNELKETLLGQHVICVDDRQFIANVTQVMVMPQPYGGLYSQALTYDGEINDDFTSERTGIVDIGRFTIDVMVDDNMQFNDGLSDSAEAGVHFSEEAVQRAYEKQFRTIPSHRVVETVLRTGMCRVNGETIDFTDERSAAIVPLREAVLNLVSTKWNTAVDIDAIYIAGGGAELVAEDIQALFPQSYVIDNPQFANAQGYLNYAHYKTGVR